MTKTRQIMLVAALVIVAVLAGWYYLARDTHEDHGSSTEIHTCPMHPSVISDRPGACPVCGMALVRKSTSQELEPQDKPSIQALSLSPTQRVIGNITTVATERRTFIRSIEAVGVLSFAEPRQATVAARFRGRVEKLHASYTGRWVGKGEPLLELYSPDLITAGEEYLLALDAPPGGNDGRILESIETRLRVHFGLTEAQVASIRESKKMPPTIAFHSPIAGTVIEKSVVEGDYVEEGRVMFRLADLSLVWAYLDVYEKDLRFMRGGNRVSIAVDAYPGEVFTGAISFIDPVVTQETRTVRVRIEVPNRHGRLKPNMFVRAKTEIQMRDVLVVPASAILSTGIRTVVWVEVQENTFEPREVITGATDGAFTVVLEGVAEGEMVAGTGGFLIDSESALTQPTSVDPHAGHLKKESE